MSDREQKREEKRSTEAEEVVDEVAEPEFTISPVLFSDTRRIILRRLNSYAATVRRYLVRGR